MATLITVGKTKEEIVADTEALDDYDQTISKIADMDRDQLTTWFSSKFGELSTSQKEGLGQLVEAVWALTKAIKRIWINIKTS